MPSENILYWSLEGIKLTFSHPVLLNHSPLREIKKGAKVKLVSLFSRQDIKEQPLSFLTQGWW